VTRKAFSAAPDPRWQQPGAGEILWCAFPNTAGLQPGRKHRPALAITVDDAETPLLRVLVAYGTSQRVTELHAGEFAILPADAGAYQLSGLSFPTKFDLARSVLLPYTLEWFAVPPGTPHGQTPRLGTLHPSLLHRFRAAATAAGLLRR
jgi:hypothetical protein